MEDDSWTSVETCEAACEAIPPESVSLCPDDMYYGETIEMKIHVVMISPNQRMQRGYLCLSTYRLIFVPYPKLGRHIDIPFSCIAEINMQEPRPTTAIGSVGYTLGLAEIDTNDTSSTIEISCKNFEMFLFQMRFSIASMNLNTRLMERMDTMSQSAPLAFTLSNRNDEIISNEIEEEEFKRLDLHCTSQHNPNVSNGFRITRINQTFRMCATYPMLAIVPMQLNDSELKTISHFRARGRIPAITYRHKETDTLLARCAQPLVGLRRRRCSSDENYIRILQNHSLGGLYIIDCRHQTSAYGNIALGAGFEIAEYYNNVPLLFMNIENIHSMRDSIRKLFELVKGEIRGSERPNWLSCLEGTRWLEHVRSVLIAAAMCVDKMVDEKASLLVHCSDGWDRTAQITSLVKLSCDPFYRTIKGFARLVQQEWISFGHRFESRCGMKTQAKKGYWEDEQCSPVFVQFIDSVWQMIQRAPCSFEFNERYLVALLDEVYARRSGSFLFDCEEQRMKARVHTRCPTVWSFLDQLPDTLNPFYIPPNDGMNVKSPCVLRFRWHTSTLSIWSGFYLRSLEQHDEENNQIVWAKEARENQKLLEIQLTEAEKQLHSQMELNEKLQSHLMELEKKTQILHTALLGQVHNESGVVLHERMEETEFQESVLLSLTQTKTDGHDFIGATDMKQHDVQSSYFDYAERHRILE